MSSHRPLLKTYTDFYRNLVIALGLNIPLIYVILMLDVRCVDFSILTSFYFSCVVIGYYVLPLLLVFTLLSIFFFPFGRLALIPIGAIITIFIYYLVIDNVVYNITKIHIDYFWLNWILCDYEAFGLQSSIIRNVILILPGIVLVEVVIFIISLRVRKPKYLVLVFSLLTFLAFGISQTIHAVAYQRNDTRITSLTPHLPAYIPITSHKNAVKYGGLLGLGVDSTRDALSELQGSLNYPLSEMKFSLLPEKRLPNIVTIFLESWRFDMMNEMVTPNIFALSQKSCVFHNHFSSGNSTVAGVIGFFYGLDPTYWTAVKANNVLIDNPVLIDVLIENQYAFGIYAKSNFERHKIKDAVFRNIEVGKSFAGKTKVEQDRDMTRQVISFIREQHYNHKPYLAFAFYKSNHFPYGYPKEDSIFIPAEDVNLMFTKDNTDPAYYLNDYMNSTHYVDRLIGKIIQQLDSLGGMSNTVIIITTDHGESFNDNKANYWGHGTNFTQYQTKVPLILYTPKREPQQIDYITSHLDIVPTILYDYFGCTNDIRDYCNGRNLFEEPKDIRPIIVGSYVNHAFIIEDNVYEICPMYTKKYKLYNIKQKASPPSQASLKTLMEEITRFYNGRDTDNDSVAAQHYMDKNIQSETIKNTDIAKFFDLQ